jgi:regulator of sigma E protease
MQVLIFLLTLSLLILIHELGHFFAAKAFGMEVEEFGIGFPPRVKKLFRWKGTLFSLNLLPIGGFVSIKGENFGHREKASDDMFWDRPIWQRAVVLLSGVFGNFVLGVVLFGIVYSVMGVPTQVGKVKVVGVSEGSPAAKVGIKEGEIIKGFTKTEDVISLIGEHKGEEIVLVLEGETEDREVKVVPRVSPPEGEGSLGVLLSDTELVKLPWWQMPFKGAVVGTKEAYAWGKEIVKGLGGMLSGLVSGEGVPEDVSGPVGIYKVSARVNEMGWLASLQFMAILSMNLAVLNILPIPALDGGRLVFLGLEMVIGKKIKNRIEGWVHGVGMIFLLGLMVLITIRDIIKL